MHPTRDLQTLPELARRVWLGQRWIWAVPVLMGLLVRELPPPLVEKGAGAMVAVALLALAYLRPGGALVVLAVFLPLQTLAFPWLWSRGVPAEILRPGSALKEVLLLGVAAAALAERHRTGRRADRIDRLALVYLGFVTLYLLFPRLFSSIAPTDLDIRLLGWRLNAGFVVAFLAARHARIHPKTTARMQQAIIGVTLVATAVALWAKVDYDGFASWVLNTVRYFQFRIDVLSDDPFGVYRVYASFVTESHRIGSIFMSFFDLPDWMLVPFGLALAHMVRSGARTRDLVVLLASGTCIFLSGTRADAIAALVMLALALRPSRKPRHARSVSILVVGLLLAAVVVVPALGSSRLAGDDATAKSSDQHRNELNFGLFLIELRPLGLGLGYNPDTADLLLEDEDHAGALTVDNSYLQVGVELGIAVMLAFLALVATIVRRLGTLEGLDPTGEGIRLAFIGVLIAGMFHHVFVTFAMPWTLWALAGLILRPRDAVPDPPESGRASTALALASR
ncbi:MAG: O-antigen ligase family protein, partial [Acidimicrobiales bacterium]